MPTRYQMIRQSLDEAEESASNSMWLSCMLSVTHVVWLFVSSMFVMFAEFRASNEKSGRIMQSAAAVSALLMLAGILSSLKAALLATGACGAVALMAWYLSLFCATFVAGAVTGTFIIVEDLRHVQSTPTKPTLALVKTSKEQVKTHD